MSDLYDLIEARFLTDALPSLSEYVSIPCLSPAFDQDWKATGAIDQAAEHLADWARARRIPGIEVRIQSLDALTPAVLIEIPASSGADPHARTTLLYGHLDKQPPLGDWSEGLDPFTAVRRDEKLYGRGTSDDGYALYAALGAIEALAATGRPYGHCLLLIEASEESGSPDLGAHLDALGPILDEVGLVVCLDSGALDFERLWVTTSLRGNIVLSVTVTVLLQGVHSGEAGGVIPSSFRILRQLLGRIEDVETGELLVPELSSQPPAHVLAAASQLANELGDPLASHFPTVPGLQVMGRDSADRLVRQSWCAALSVTGLEGAPPVAEAGNVLRASTTAKLSIRTPPDVDAAAAQHAVAEMLRIDPPYGATVEIVEETPAQGWVAPVPTRWLADALDQGSRDAFGNPPGMVGEGGSIPFLAALGERLPDAQMVATGVLGPGTNAHGPDEMLHLPTAVGVAAALAHVLEAAAERGKPGSEPSKSQA